MEGNPNKDKSIPGPGKYSPVKATGSEALKYSMSSKLLLNRSASQKNMPGPGEYKTLGINNEGKYPCSNIKNIRAILWGQLKTERFQYKSIKNI